MTQESLSAPSGDIPTTIDRQADVIPQSAQPALTNAAERNMDPMSLPGAWPFLHALHDDGHIAFEASDGVTLDTATVLRALPYRAMPRVAADSGYSSTALEYRKIYRSVKRERTHVEEKDSIYGCSVDYLARPVRIRKLIGRPGVMHGTLFWAAPDTKLCPNWDKFLRTNNSNFDLVLLDAAKLFWDGHNGICVTYVVDHLNRADHAVMISLLHLRPDIADIAQSMFRTEAIKAGITIDRNGSVYIRSRTSAHVNGVCTSAHERVLDIMETINSKAAA